MSFGSSSSKQSSSSTQTLDPGIMGQINQGISNARAVAQQPFQAYTGQLGAGTNGNTTAASNAAQGLLGFTAPNVTASTYDPVTGQSSTYQAQTGQASTYDPTTIDRSKIQNVSGGLLTDLDLSKYMSPYTSGVIDASIADNERARQLARGADSDAAISAGAFGGSREGVTKALTNELYDQNSLRTISGLRESGYNTALGAAQSDLTRMLQAATANQGVDLGVEQTNAAALNSAGQFNAGQRQAMDTTNLAALNTAGQFNAGQTQDMTLANMNALNDAGQFNANQRQTADISNQDASIRSAGVQSGAAGLLGDIGAREREAQQAALDRQYADYQYQQQWPVTMQQLELQALGLLPDAKLTSSQSSGKSSGFNLGIPTAKG